jgi:hypothetical protein
MHKWDFLQASTSHLSKFFRKIFNSPAEVESTYGRRFKSYGRGFESSGRRLRSYGIGFMDNYCRHLVLLASARRANEFTATRARNLEIEISATEGTKPALRRAHIRNPFPIRGFRLNKKSESIDSLFLFRGVEGIRGVESTPP